MPRSPSLRLTILWALAATLSAAHAIAAPSAAPAAKVRPRVVITTDINILHGDPDDRQSLVHLLFYLDELDVKVIVADRSVERRDNGALRACHLAVDAYAKDYHDPNVKLRARGFPAPELVRSWIKPGDLTGLQAIIDEARRDDPRPLYVLVWGHMLVLEHALYLAPDIVPKLRVLSIGTWSNPHAPRGRPGANSAGRDDLYRDFNYRGMWWIENSAMFAGMFHGLEFAPGGGAGETQRIPVGGPPFDFLKEIAKFGALGRHLVEVTEGNRWAEYFRAGDTPTVLYLLDPAHDPDNPAQPGWAGVFERPFPDQRPNHWIDASFGLLDHERPEKTQANAAEARRKQVEAFLAVRPKVYDAFLAKLRSLYPE